MREADALTAAKNALKARPVGTFEGPGVPALCRRWAVPCKGASIFSRDARDEFCTQLPSFGNGDRLNHGFSLRHSVCPRRAEWPLERRLCGRERRPS
jgi:hypothetical protein